MRPIPTGHGGNRPSEFRRTQEKKKIKRRPPSGSSGSCLPALGIVEAAAQHPSSHFDPRRHARFIRFFVDPVGFPAFGFDNGGLRWSTVLLGSLCQPASMDGSLASALKGLLRLRCDSGTYFSLRNPEHTTEYYISRTEDPGYAGFGSSVPPCSTWQST
ncbi:hypothetical protein BO70DRAFT_183028 [Aspergillus heteromorphus CBS 117.55]|uniref:Uncharacterized protein n=1 Tax=Aspergillus heteromorphus CBS 117.55 TaxID=1448321 RepID=A0A317WTH2_9EURO|nr:uncharacterized protein BO70DRAFT_183028 [Aspergillus heteromorphus CBS 117.55]PWY88487.1 hypothetical protein BO70DRAFT_183028 [Aspergillus heteromorphus CBS 117.55]